MKTSKTARRVGAVVLTLVLLVLLVVAAVMVALRTARPRTDGTMVVGGIAAPVEILRDSMGVPHIRAGSERDLLFAQGWTHAQDRLWQMELFRRVAEGRLAEILGPSLISTDRFLRTIGTWRAAGEQLKQVDAETRASLEAYAAGVNAWLEHRRGLLPPEFVLLRLEPEPWTPRHTLAIERIMAWDLGAWGVSVAAARAAAMIGPERAAQLVPAYPEWAPVILPGYALPEIPPVAAALLDAVSMTRASNAWVIGGSRTASGKPILANDMHLALRAPSLWYLMALHAGPLDVVGMTIPGVPWVIAGHNRAIAWGFTNASLDDLDLFVEKLDPADPSRYLTPEGSEPFEVLRDSIRVRGQPAEYIEIRLTRHGPVLNDVADPESRGPIAMRWAGHDVSRTINAFPALNRAADWDAFVAAVRDFDNPHQNVVYADTSGTIGYVMGGRIPRRANGQRPPVLPVPGWAGEWDWTAFLPKEAHPIVHDPPEDFVVTANNRQAAGDAAERITTYWEQPHRATRIRQMIEAARELDAAAVHAMQLDVKDALAERYRPLAVEAAQEAGLEETARLLQDWDLRASRESEGAARFYAWYETMHRDVRRTLYGGQGGPLSRNALDAVLERAVLPWGDTTPAGFRSLAATAMRTADSIAAGRTWGEIHEVFASHTLAAVPILERWLRLDVGHDPADGSSTTVNVSDYAPGTLPIRSSYGPSQRHVVDMAAIDDAGGFILPTGQSGLPFDRHYRDQYPLWLNGGLWRIPLDSAQAEARAVRRLRLEPVTERNGS